MSTVVDDYDDGNFNPSQTLQPQNIDTPSGTYQFDHTSNHIRPNTNHNVLSQYNNKQNTNPVPPRRRHKFDISQFSGNAHCNNNILHISFLNIVLNMLN